MPSSIEQTVADIISNSSPAMQLAQVGAKIKESLDSIVESIVESLAELACLDEFLYWGFWQTTNSTIVINLPSAMAFSAAEIRFTF